MPSSEICERHLVGAADLRVQMVNLAREAVRWKPLGHRIRIKKRSIDLFGLRTNHAVEPNCICRCHTPFLFGEWWNQTGTASTGLS